jgi:hypothetical protein
MTDRRCRRGGGQVDGGRMLHVGWFNFGAGNANCLTAPREVSYDAARRKLLALPVRRPPSIGILARLVRRNSYRKLEAFGEYCLTTNGRESWPRNLKL